MRGGNGSRRAVRPPQGGSSPLARGKRPDRRRDPHGVRIIPACAGETASGVMRTPRQADHPRLRGGNSSHWRTRHPSAGSSPLARGKHPAHPGRRPRPGIIPACAGETVAVGCPVNPHGDHPRLRGGNITTAVQAIGAIGSSPLARGKRPHRGPTAPLSRIIPACAGETGGGQVAGNWPRDHPRLRGGNRIITAARYSNSGSSPLARGKRTADARGRDPQRIIPACAGETPRGQGLVGHGRDHPRLRGGNPRRSCMSGSVRGSSPLARGKLTERLALAPDLGIIPACAGETRSARCRRR